MMRRAGLLLLLVLMVGCSESTKPQNAAVAIQLTAGGFSDDRTYSVGRVQLRALDVDNTVLALQIFNIDRATGVIDVIFLVPAGTERRVLVEPLGSGILPNGGKTESGVALQGMSEQFDMDAGATVELEVPLLPYIPDNLFFESQSGTSIPFALNWTAMPTAASHEVRVISFDQSTSSLVNREVPVTAPPVPLDVLGGTQEIVIGYQVRSVNEFSVSAFSDTLFTSSR